MLSLDEVKRRCALFSTPARSSSAYVFGSYARGEHDEDSDVDICYDKPDASAEGMPRVWAVFDEHAQLRNALESAFGLPVDLLPTPYERMHGQPSCSETLCLGGKREYEVHL